MDFKDTFFKEEFIDAVSAIAWHHYQEKVVCSDAQHNCKLQSLLSLAAWGSLVSPGLASYGEG